MSRPGFVKTDLLILLLVVSGVLFVILGSMVREDGEKVRNDLRSVSRQVYSVGDGVPPGRDEGQPKE